VIDIFNNCRLYIINFDIDKFDIFQLSLNLNARFKFNLRNEST